MKSKKNVRRFKKRFKKAFRKRSSIRRLSRSVRKLAKKARMNTTKMNYFQNVNLVALSAAPSIVNLCNYTNLVTTPIFGSALGQFNRQVLHRKTTMDIQVSLENATAATSETASIQFTIFLVSLRDAANATGFFDPGSGALLPVAGTHYVANAAPGGASGSGGHILLNPRHFRIHKMKKFTLTNYGQHLDIAAAQSQYGTTRRWTWRQRMGGYITNPSGSWTSLSTAQDPSKQYYILVFCNNSLADLESPSFTMSAVHSMTSLGSTYS